MGTATVVTGVKAKRGNGGALLQRRPRQIGGGVIGIEERKRCDEDPAANCSGGRRRRFPGLAGGRGSGGGFVCLHGREMKAAVWRGGVGEEGGNSSARLGGGNGGEGRRGQGGEKEMGVRRKGIRRGGGVLWCRACSQILPAFCRLSNNFPKLCFVYADIDQCPQTTQHIRYTPTFHFYRDGERVDEMFGTGEQRLHDRLWLHS
ncbi:hypothetical protein Tsubulata_022127 [Turnera subulata]|uniref:Thioredoxin domain-containing protein n=1 Tax=Turnera subulata TaxID=218843 RepID=A0A9Q0FG15_9ROSI|nr:hypothetical protein Tsubulata_022127 [Turnera subulata]